MAREKNTEFTTFEAVRCPLCGVDPIEFAVDFEGLHLSRCPRCGLEFESPRPSFAELAEKVYNHRYQVEVDVGEPEPARRADHARQLRLIEAVAGGRGALLDVGCGTAEFLRLAAERGWQVSGTDIHLDPKARARISDLREGQLLEIDFGGRRFDAVRFQQVLEHTLDPLAELRRGRELLRSGGALYVSVPNLGGASPRLKSLQSRLGLKSRRYRHYAARHHLWFFTRATLGRLIAAAGFTVVHWETPVRARSHRAAWATGVFRLAFEPLRLGSLLDFYCRAR